MDIRQFRDFIVRPALQQINAWTPNAEQLVMATAMAESNIFFVFSKSGAARRAAFSKWSLLRMMIFGNGI
jgi:hypothetical protein